MNHLLEIMVDAGFWGVFTLMIILGALLDFLSPRLEKLIKSLFKALLPVLEFINKPFTK